MILEIEKLAEKIGVFEKDLITRAVGRNLYEVSTEKLNYLTEDELLIIDFSGIKVIDSSFIDEFFIKILDESFKEKPFYIKVKNINEILELNINTVLQTYSRYRLYKLAVVTNDICENNSFYLGSLNKNEKEIFEYIRINKFAKFDDIKHYIDNLNDETLKNIGSLMQMRVIRQTDRNVYSSL